MPDRFDFEEASAGATARIALNRELLSGQPRVVNRDVLERILERVPTERIPTPGVPGEPAPAPGPIRPLPSPSPAAVPIVPAPPEANPFVQLPLPAPGDRIKADDFKQLSQSLKTIADLALLSAQLFGRTLGEANRALVGQGYAVARVMSVFGNEASGPTDTSFDRRRVLQVLPAVLGERNVMVVVTEAVETRRFAPNFTTGGVSYTYRQAVETMRSVLGEAGLSGLPMDAPNLTDKSLAQAAQEIGGRR